MGFLQNSHPRTYGRNERFLILAKVLFITGYNDLPSLFTKKSGTLSDIQVTVTTLTGANWTFEPMDTPLPTERPPTPTKTFTPRPPMAIPTAIALPERISDAQGVEMVLIPVGEFQMGGDADAALAECQKLYIGGTCEHSWYEDEEPNHNVRLDAYYMDVTEVTNAQYADCVKAGLCTEPRKKGSSTQSNYYGSAEYADYPVIYVDWQQALTYCEWRGSSLPTEAQWEKAARGTDGLMYPWGNSFDGSKANFCDRNCSLNYANKAYDDGYADTAPVGTYLQGESPYSLLDMAGNVWEWVKDWYDVNYYFSAPLANPLGPGAGEYRVVRGGAWGNVGNGLRAAIRDRNLPSDAYNNLGFRCARTP